MSHAPFVKRSALTLRPDPSMVVLRPFSPSVEPRALFEADANRVLRITERVLSLGEARAKVEFAGVMAGFRERHRDIRAIFQQRYEEMAAPYVDGATPSASEKLLIGAYFCHEYSFQSAALFNPSVVPHPDQSDLMPGRQRIILSLRAVGEGHVSSVTFRTGEVSCDGYLAIDPASSHCSIPTLVAAETADGIDTVHIRCNGSDALDECVIFPVTRAQRNGIEDLRLVRFEDDDGAVTYYGTYTAYSGTQIASEMLSTTDFCDFRLKPLAGDAAHNKGMALFPRRVGGRYMMLGRQDNENIWLLESDDVYAWNGGRRILQPKFPWEYTQIGNCGAPVEIDEGWLALTHGVGAVRNYAIGAFLLDKHDPGKVLGRTTEPILRADHAEREGYVPNVVYTCGALVCGRNLIVPYGIADSVTSFAMMSVDDLLAAMR
jgi:predicted GH43/DUF377 family glycosyl hydrolase